MKPTPWMRLASSGVTRENAPPTTALERPAESFRCGGQNVCRAHGGGSPQAKAKAAAMVELAELKLRNLAPRAVDVLERLLTAESEAVALGAARDLTDRAGGKATEKIQVAAQVVVHRPW